MRKVRCGCLCLCVCGNIEGVLASLSSRNLAGESEAKDVVWFEYCCEYPFLSLSIQVIVREGYCRSSVVREKKKKTQAHFHHHHMELMDARLT
ncbi:hypothetical protein B0F90DRAFT_876108 [Multifurca ochricompacta]|uniref:Secreted protein n=1 Tax=Multifurca ochricompacta TaxID=376703 RepID=A0AAD4LTB9_9AGAM|nr:hypothetical protein B0F90DRAFT_876108 [Multifurca ochricompacta]